MSALMPEGHVSIDQYDAERERRRFATLWVGIVAFVVTLILVRGQIVAVQRDAVSTAAALASAIVAPPLVWLSFRLVNRDFKAVQAAIVNPDTAVKDAAIITALELPKRGAIYNAVAWSAGYVLAWCVGQLFIRYNAAETVTHFLDGLAIVPLISFPIYALIESRLRPPLRILSEQTVSTGRERVIPFRFDIGKRVLLTISSLMIASGIYANSKASLDLLGIDAPEIDEQLVMIVNIPIFILMIAVTGMSVVVSLRGSIAELTRAVSAAADGDLRRRAAVTSTDELGLLMVDVDRMLGSQSRLLRTSSDVARDVTLSADAVAEGSEQSTTGISEIAMAMQDVVSGAQKQFDQIEIARKATEQLNAAIEAATGDSAQAARVSASARDLAEDGAVAAGEAREAMSRMQGTIESARSAVDRLGNDTADIGTIVETIVAIAAQTNLLALNAAIEAARAGEQGRGFAVVAEEVRQLATESSDAAAEISSLIKSIEQTVVETVSAVGIGAGEVVDGAAVVDAAGQKFGDISNSLATIDEHVQRIDSRTGEVASATASVTDAVDEILHVTESVASLAEQTSANTEEASASSEEITSSADTLRSMAKDLEGQIAVFRV